jgi:predicted porin
MKKHLIAAAVAAAVAAPVMAQNVSISGYIEQGIENTKTNGSATTTNINTGAFGSSRLAITGSEDLGGGLKAGMRLEMSLGSTTGTGGASTLGAQSTAGALFNRGSDFNLSGAFGTVKVGKLDHPGIEGNETVSGVVGNIGLFDTAVEGISAAGSASDTNSTVIYSLPAMSGHTLTVGYTGKNDGATNVVTHEGIRSYQLAGKVGAISYKLGGGGVKQSGGTTSFMGGGVSTMIGAIEVAAQYQKNDVISSNVDITQTQVAAKMPLGNGMDVRVVYGSLDYAQQQTNDADTLTLAVAKALSKRTNVYGMYRTKDIKAAGGADTKELGVYIGHSF